VQRPVTYSALAAFYRVDPRRRASRETDFGLWWRGEDGLPSYRAAWVEATGELYLVQHGPGRGGGRVTVMGHEADRDALERRLTGWREICGRPGSVRWLRDRLDERGSVRPGARTRGRRPGSAPPDERYVFQRHAPRR
jgi:hypothetical protein